MKYTKVRNVKDPERAHPGDAGIDFYIPEFSERFLRDLVLANIPNRTRLFYGVTLGNRPGDLSIVMGPHERVLIPSGIHVKLRKGTKLQAANKSGNAHKLGLDVLAELVDESYQGEVHISVVNTSNDIVELTANMKIIQFVITKYEDDMPELVPSKIELYEDVITERGEEGFGSSGI
jgi:dUTP pyrophosphatase